MDIQKLTEIYGLTNLPEGQFEYIETEINSKTVEALQNDYGVFDSERFEYVKAQADLIAADEEAKSVFSWLYLLLGKREKNERIKVTRIVNDKRFEMAAYFSILCYMPTAVEFLRSRGIADDMIRQSILTAFANGLKATDDGFFFDVMRLYSWSQLYIDGKLLRIGVLNFELRDRVKEDCGGRLSPDDAVINVHIPAKVKLTEQNCEFAYSECARIVKSSFPEFDYKAFVCFSWMMDKQLKDMLKPDSNIVKFQSRYTTFFRDKPTDGVFVFVYGYNAGVKPDLGELAEDTSLRRAIKSHLLAGGSIYADGGIFTL